MAGHASQPPFGASHVASISLCMRAAANTPVESLGCFAHFPSDSSLHRFNVGSASTSPFSGPAQRSLHVAARMLAESPRCDPLHRRLQPFRHLHDCSDCYRLERKLPGLSPTGKSRFCTTHCGGARSWGSRRPNWLRFVMRPRGGKRPTGIRATGSVFQRLRLPCFHSPISLGADGS